MKNIVFILVVLSCIACEPDDICIEETPGTPQLILRFYDAQNPTVRKPVNSLEIQGIGSDIVQNLSDIDSVAIPLKIVENQTEFIFKNNEQTDIIRFSYTSNNVYISRSCGYQSVFNLASASIDQPQSWIQELVINTSEIINENQAHVTLLY